MKTAIDLKLLDWMTGIRRHIHQNPELSFQEYETSSYICEKLDELGIKYRKGIAGTGILASFGDNGKPSPCVAIRADMDALPLEEKTGLPFASQKPGIMHACGHDGHVAMVLGAAALLKKMEPGRIALIFQPAEENGGGAEKMVKEGVLDGISCIIGGHIDRHLNIGEVAIQPGLICAFTDEFRIEIKGRGGHAAKPHETVDSIVVASLLVMSIQTLVSREVNPAFPSVVTVGRINGGTAPNVICDRAVLEGTVRTTDAEIRSSIIKGLSRMVKAMEGLYNAETSIDFYEGYSPVINDTKVTELVREAAEKTIGTEGVKGLPHPSMGGEDFSAYLKQVPGCFIRLGAGKDELLDVPAHSSRFDFDERVLGVGASLMANAACRLIDNF